MFIFVLILVIPIIFFTFFNSTIIYNFFKHNYLYFFVVIFFYVFFINYDLFYKYKLKFEDSSFLIKSSRTISSYFGSKLFNIELSNEMLIGFSFLKEKT